MSKKNKRARGRRQTEIDHVQIGRRELGKRNAKLALEHARLGHQQSPNAESRELLERSLLARAEQLYNRGSHEIAKGMIDELTSLGVTVPDLAQPLQRLQVFLGIASAGADARGAEAGAVPEELAASLTDEAVLRPQRRCPSYSDLNQQADLVREVLRAIEDGDDSAIERLADIPRKSPFADWRLFARGLAGYYAGDADRTAANWDRLDTQRPAFRIASHLLVFSGQRQLEQCGFDMATGQKRLQRAVTGNPVISQLESIRDQFQAGQIGYALQTLRSLRLRSGEKREGLLERLTDLLWKRLVREGDERSASKLFHMVSGPPLDPQWNRARALLAEERQDTNLNRLEDLWRAYVHDLRQCSALSEEERKFATGLVLLRLAREFVQLARSEANISPHWMDEEDEEDQAEYVADVRRQAERHLREAVRQYPALLAAHRELVSLLQDADRSDDAVEAARQLVEQFPDDFETLTWLGNYFIEADEPIEAEPYIDRVSRLRPRDEAIQTLVWNHRLGMLRQLVRKRKFDEARQRLQEAFVAPPNTIYPYVFDVLQATIEYKAKNFEAAERHLQAAQQQLQEPTVIWLMMHSCADRYRLDRKLKNDFRDRFKAAVKARCTSQTAGHMAHYLTGFLARRVKYVGLATHQRLVLDYLNRAKRVEWHHEDLRNVCEFLCLVDHWRSDDLLEKLLANGCKRFPKDPLFPLLSAVQDMEVGPYRANFDHIERNFKLALELNETAEHRLSQAQVEKAKVGLSAVHSTREMMSSLMGGLGEFLAGGFAMDDEEEEDDWDDEDDEWDDEDDWDEDAADRLGGAPKNASTTSGGSRRRTPRSDKRQQYFEF